MSIIAVVGRWAVTNLPTVVKGIKKAASLVEKGATYVDTLMEGRAILTEDAKHASSSPPPRTKAARPDIMGDTEESDEPYSQLVAQIDESKKQLKTVESENLSEHKRIQLQIDMMELIVSASTIERFTNNINIHAANLQIHLQTIQNTAGLLDSVNRQRVAIKTIMRTVNHLINTTGSKGTVDPIAGIDIEMREGSISIYGAYEAFENTKSLLLGEIGCYLTALDDQSDRIESVRAAARQAPKLRAKINDWIESSLEPSLNDAKSLASELQGDLTVLPALETTLKRNLKEAVESDEEKI